MKAERRSEQHQLQSQIQTAPFVKSDDRIKKDVSDMSMSDFAPKRFALKYEPIPMIVLEYLVPSTGKLYHHKMKLRQLTGDSDPDEMLAYLEKRHPLYFLQRKLSKPQIKALLKKIIYRVGQMKPKPTAASAVAQSSATKPATESTAATKANPSPKNDIFSQNKRQHLRDLESKVREKENQESASTAPKGGLSSLAGAPQFKTGSQLPTLSEDFPPVGVDSKKKNAAAIRFNDQFDNEFSAGEDEDLESLNEANNQEEDEEDEDGDFDANELLNLGSYQQKRLGMGNGPAGAPTATGLGRDKENPLPALAPIGLGTNSKPSALPNKLAPPAQRSVLGSSTVKAGADECFDFSDEEDVTSEEEESKQAAKTIDFNNFDYKKADLNKLGDAELKAHKAAMEVKFQQNAVKKGDPGFEYDKRVKFERNMEEAQEDSWDESDESEDQGVEIVAANKRVLSKPKGVGLQNREEPQRRVQFDELEDNDYFDDDFDDDFK